MSNQRSNPISWRIVKLAVVLLTFAASLGASRFASRAQDLPDGKGPASGVAAVRAKCLTCHEADLITQQRLGRPGWVREVDKMIRWGAVVSDAEKEPMIEYLAAHFGPKPMAALPAAAAAEERGREIFQNKCLVCHEADLTEQQRLTRAGWVREVEKMIRWGAAVSEAEKGPLVDYLAGRFGPQQKPAK